jgi:hypothetical protein
MTIFSRVRACVVVVSVVGVLAMSGTPTAAADPLDYVVHTERIQVGPYPMAIGFTVWPLRAMQSLDLTFVPDSGIADKSGIVTQIAPDGRQASARLARHPRNRAVWGLDVHSFDSAGTWTLRFEIEGPDGTGTANLAVDALNQPGPPLALSWAIGLIPLMLTLAFFTAVWLRTKSPVAESS